MAVGEGSPLIGVGTQLLGSEVSPVGKWDPRPGRSRSPAAPSGPSQRRVHRARWLLCAGEP